MTRGSHVEVRTSDAHVVKGHKGQALAHYREHGLALWLRPCGRATLYYRAGGARCQRTWTTYSEVE